MKRKIIITLNYDEYLRFCYKQIVPKNDAVYIGESQQGTTPECLYGIENPEGYFYGRWYLRTDLLNIFLHLKLSTPDVAKSQRLREIFHLGQEKRTRELPSTL